MAWQRDRRELIPALAREEALSNVFAFTALVELRIRSLVSVQDQLGW